MLEILRGISPTSLRILHVQSSWARLHTPLIPVQLPALAELYISDIIKETNIYSSLVAPALERLYIGGFLDAPEPFGLELRRICPRLTHLRIAVNERNPLDDNVLRLLHTYGGSRRTLESMRNSWMVRGALVLVQDENEHEPNTDAGRRDLPVIVDDGSLPQYLKRIVIEFSPKRVPDGGFPCGNARDPDHQCV